MDVRRSISRIFVRNMNAGDLFELFLVAAVSAILVIRLYLELAGYPQLGGDSLHIAHMLWGGLLMAVAILLMLFFLGQSVDRWAAIIGGAGFGTFIDEIGKFVTQDNDYFYEPAVALMYVTFILIVLMTRLMRRGRYSSNEYLLNALQLIEEVAVHDLDPEEQRQAMEYLKRANPQDPLVPALQHMLQNAATVPLPPPGPFTRFKHILRSIYLKLVTFRGFELIVVAFFMIQLLIKFIYLFVIIAKGLHAEQIISTTVFSHFVQNIEQLSFSQWAELISSIFSAVFIFLGVMLLRRSTLLAYAMFERSVLISIFITQVFMFYQDQFAALVGLFLNLILLAILRYMIERESKSR